MEFLRKLFGGGPPPAPSRTSLTLRDLLPGDLLDHDLATWKVLAVNRHDYKDFQTREWQLESPRGLRYLELEEDDEPFWTWSEAIPFASLGKAWTDRVRAALRTNGDPPDAVERDGVVYHLDSDGGGHFFKDCLGQGQPFLFWDYVDDSGERFLTLEQWGEDEFEASLGRRVKEWEFTNLLPGSAG